MPVNKPGIITDFAIVKGNLQEVFDFLASFDNTQLWDPTIAHGKRHDEGPLKVGSTFDIQVISGKKLDDYLYTITEMESPKRVVIVGDSKNVKTIDVMEFTDLNDGTIRVDYEAEIIFKTFLRFAVRLLGGILNKLGRNAMLGMEAHFNDPKPSPTDDEKSSPDTKPDPTAGADNE